MTVRYPHRIRLHGPWEFRSLEPDRSLACRVTIPCRWRDTPVGNFSGRAKLIRRFGIPRVLDSWERVWLFIAGIADPASISVNDHLLGHHTDPEQPFECETTSILKQRNQLEVEIESSGPDGGILGEVALEIRGSARLRNVRVRNVAGRLEVAGQVIGVADHPLDLYVLQEGTTLAYVSVAANRVGNFFAVTSDPLPDCSGDSVKVELVNGGVVWDCVMIDI
jgi:hypothetical protein